MAELFADAADRSETAEAATAHEQQVGRFGRLAEDIDGRTINPVDRQPLELLRVNRCGVACNDDT